jgi:crotonobetaine/carnitine-CoA ligase
MTSLQNDSGRDDWTVIRLLENQAKAHPQRICLDTIEGHSWTYSEIWKEVQRLGFGLHLEGVRAGDTVVIMTGNTVEAVQSWLAVNMAEAVEVTINIAYRGPLLIHAIKTALAKTIIIEDRFVSELVAVADQLPQLTTVIVLGQIGRMKCKNWRVLAFSELRKEPPADWSCGARYCDVASIIYTSGTSGPAKGVMLTHAQNYLAALTAVQGLRLGASDVYYCAHPLFHMAGKFLAAEAIFLAGGKLYLDKGFAGDKWLATISQSQATVTVAHGPMLEMIHSQPSSKYDGETKLTRILGCPLPKRIAQSFEQRFRVKVIEGYGMTEIGVPCWRRYDDDLRVGSCGKLLTEFFELKICDPDTDETLPDGSVGEILVRPRLPWTLMQGYAGMPDRTMEAWRNLWFHTGDAGYRDSEGYHFFVDRLKDRIRRRAESISSYDIETVALSYSPVADCAAVGVPSEYENDDDIKLCVVMSSVNLAFDPIDLLRHLAISLPHFMVPRYVEVLETLPRTPTNKVKRAALREEGVTSRTWDRKASGISLKDLAKPTP